MTHVTALAAAIEQIDTALTTSRLDPHWPGRFWLELHDDTIRLRWRAYTPEVQAINAERRIDRAQIAGCVDAHHLIEDHLYHFLHLARTLAREHQAR